MESTKSAQIAANLEEARALHSELLLAAESKREGLVALDLDALRAATAREEKLVERMKENEAGRREMVAAAALENGIAPGEALRLREVLGFLDADSRERIGSLRAELIKLAGAIRRLNATNKLLAEQTLAHMHGFLSLIAGTAAQGRNYSPGSNGGRKSSDTVPLVIDRKV